jgi:hypothetical protein
MDAHGRSWTLMDAHGRSWTLMDAHGRSWTLMDAHGRSWTLMDAHRRSWTLMDAHGRSWTLMDAHGRSWTLMDAHGRSWTLGRSWTILGRFSDAGRTQAGRKSDDLGRSRTFGKFGHATVTRRSRDGHATVTRRSRSRFRFIRNTVYIVPCLSQNCIYFQGIKVMIISNCLIFFLFLILIRR